MREIETRPARKRWSGKEVEALMASFVRLHNIKAQDFYVGNYEAFWGHVAGMVTFETNFFRTGKACRSKAVRIARKERGVKDKPRARRYKALAKQRKEAPERQVVPNSTEGVLAFLKAFQQFNIDVEEAKEAIKEAKEAAKKASQSQVINLNVVQGGVS